MATTALRRRLAAAAALAALGLTGAATEGHAATMLQPVTPITYQAAPDLTFKAEGTGWATVVNQGRLGAGPFWATITSRNGSKQDYYFTGLAAGATKTMYDPNINPSGGYCFNVVVDSHGNVAESNENNNVMPTINCLQ